MNKIVFYMKATFGVAFMYFLVTSYSCSHRKINSHDVKAIHLIVNYPVVNGENGKVSNLGDTLPIYFFEDYILHSVPAVRDFTTNNKIAGTEEYFLFGKNDKKGHLYSSLTDTMGLQLQIDSFLSKRAFWGLNFKPLDSTWKLINRESVNTNLLIERYYNEFERQENAIDSIYYHFNDLKDIHYSFSPILDSLKNMKLFKIQLIYNQEYSTQANIQISRREYLFEFKRFEIRNYLEIRGFFDRFKKYYLHNNSERM